MKIIHNAGLFPLLCLGLAPAAMAQDAGETSVTLPEVSVSAPADTAFFAPDTASQGAVTGKEIEEQPRSRVGEVLEVVPGLIATQHSGEGKANQYFLRGFNLDHGTDIDITLDDMPVNMRTHGHGQGYADLNFMIPELISTLHYSKGPYFPDLGDFDTAGAVQINYVDTLPHDLALVTAGTLGYYRGLGAASRPVGAGNLLAAAEYVHDNGPWTIPDNYNKGNLVLNYSQGNTNNGFSFTGMYMNDAFHATNQIPQRAVAEGLICLYCPLDPTDGGSSERYSFSTKYAATTETGQVNANAYFIGYQLQLFNDFDGFVTFPPPIGDQFVQQDRRKIYGGNVSYMMPGNIFGYDAKNTIGFQTRTDDIHIDLAETTGRVVRFTVRDDHVIEFERGGLHRKPGPMGGQVPHDDGSTRGSLPGLGRKHLAGQFRKYFPGHHQPQGQSDLRPVAGYRILRQRRPGLSQQRFTGRLDECRRIGDRNQLPTGQPDCRRTGQDAIVDQGDRL